MALIFHFKCTLKCRLQSVSNWTSLKFCHLVMGEPFPKQQILDSSKLKEFADNNFEFVENSKKFSKGVEHTM